MPGDMKVWSPSFSRRTRALRAKDSATGPWFRLQKRSDKHRSCGFQAHRRSSTLPTTFLDMLYIFLDIPIFYLGMSRSFIGTPNIFLDIPFIFWGLL